MPHGGPHLPDGTPLAPGSTTEDSGLTGSPSEEPPQVGTQQSDAPPPIGVPEFIRGPGGEPVPFTATRQRTLPGTQDVLTSRGPLGERGRPPSQVTQRIPPQYFRGHEKLPRLLGLNSTEDIIRTQMMMNEAGLLEGRFSPGVWDKATWEAMHDILGHANVNGLDWETALTDLVTNPPVDIDEDGAGGADVELPPDYATLEQAVKAHAASKLGRDLRDYEVKLLADELAGGYSQQLQAQYEAGTVDAVPVGTDELGQPVNAEGEVIIPPEGGEQAPTKIDPKARFEQSFEERYSGEIATVELEEEAARTQQVASRGANLLRRMIGS